MKILFRLILWDLKLQVRNSILTVAIFIAVFYTAFFLLLGLRGKDDILIALIFSDPTFMGFIFTGVLVLFEKSANTLQALVVTPIKIWQYLFSKAVSLTIITSIICFAMVFASHGFRFNYFWFLVATFLSSVLFIFLGFIGVAKVKTFNQYIIVIPLFIAPLSLPYLYFFGVSNSWLFYILPTQGALILFRNAFEKVAVGDTIYALVYLILSIWIAYRISKQLFLKHIVRGE
ncbi:MAG TPA: ABC transporter permease [Draconibacterium sp.]|nr:ABC transporter permease [Draconibacterium sp.]